MPRTIEPMTKPGLTKEALKRVISIVAFNPFLNGKRVTRIEFQKHLADLPYPDLFMLLQHQTEALLIRNLLSQDGDIEWGYRASAWSEERDADQALTYNWRRVVRRNNRTRLLKASTSGFVAGLADAWAMIQFTRLWNMLLPQDAGHAPRQLRYSQQEWDATSRLAEVGVPTVPASAVAARKAGWGHFPPLCHRWKRGFVLCSCG